MTNEPRTKEKIQEALSAVEKEILDLENSLNAQHEESGSNSLDDDSQEVVADQQKLSLIAEQLDHKRQEMLRLQEELQRAG